MEFTSALLCKLVYEINSSLRNRKLYEVSKYKDTFYLSFYPGRKTLCFSLNPTFFRIHLCNNLQTTKELHPFLLILRKYITGATLQSAKQLNFDRVIELTFTTKLTPYTEKTFYLYIELIHRYSNAVLTDERGIILGTFKNIEGNKNSARIIVTGIKYEPPPIGKRLNPLTITKEEFLSVATSNPKWKKLFTGMSKDVVELLDSAGSDTEKAWKLFKEWIEKVKSPPLHPISPEIESHYRTKEERSTLQIEFSRATKSIKKGKNRLVKKLHSIEEELKEAYNFEHYKQLAESLLTYKNQVKHEEGKITVPNIYKPGETFTLILNRDTNLNKEAERLFKHYKKLKRKLEILPDVRAKLLEKLSSIEEMERRLPEMSLEELKQVSNTVEKEVEDSKGRLPYRRFEVEGWDILVGKNSRTNDILTFKIADREDLWFHAKDIGGSHIVLKTSRKITPPERIIRIAAEIAAFYSKAHTGTKVRVDYTKRKYVKKPPHSPEGYVTYKKHRSILVKKAQVLQDILQSP